MGEGSVEVVWGGGVLFIMERRIYIFDVWWVVWENCKWRILCFFVRFMGLLKVLESVLLVSVVGSGLVWIIWLVCRINVCVKVGVIFLM